MPTVSESALSVAANAKSTDRLNGSNLEVMPFDGEGQLSARASATGLNVSLIAGGEVVIDDQPIPYTGTAGGLSIRDNLMDDPLIAGGAKLQLFFRNTTGAAITVDYVLKAVPVEE